MTQDDETRESGFFRFRGLASLASHLPLELSYLAPPGSRLLLHISSRRVVTRP
jgi:hypothetical protein